MTFTAKNIPKALAKHPNWVCWKTITRSGMPTKVPVRPDGKPARSNDPSTWTSLDGVLDAFTGEFDGIGFVFDEAAGLCGVDLDGCRNPDTGEVAEWAKEIVTKFATYAEVSPSLTGVKLFCEGKSPFESGKKIELSVERVCDKTPAIEVYDRLRYFAVTGWRLKGPHEPKPASEALAWLKAKYWAEVKPKINGTFYCEAAIIDRARKYLAKVPPAVAGSGGHNRTFHAACVLVCGFGLGQHDALNILREWNQACQPPWSERELLHKIQDAAKQDGPRNYLRMVKQDQWGSVEIPSYTAEKPQTRKQRTTLVAAARQCLEKVRQGKTDIVSLGIPELDFALDGGVEPGELVIIGARPSHGKSAVALQFAHHWTFQGSKVLLISEEMSAIAMGKRTLQFASDIPRENWNYDIEEVEKQLTAYEETRQDVIVVESCGTALAAVAEIDRAVEEDKVKMAIVDYAQLLRSEGKTRYEQITNTSVLLRQAASRHKIVLLVLCQLSRAIETRQKFAPMMSDIKETGQLEQDADVIIFLCWPHRMDSKRDPKEYQFFVCKNRNRAINRGMVTCKFDPSRQTIGNTAQQVESEYAHAFDEWNS